MKPYGLINRDLFFAKVDDSPGHGPDRDCHLWTGTLSGSGAGTCTAKADGKTCNFKAHRAAHWFQFGYMPDDMFCVHTCGMNACVNPRHLYVSPYKKGEAPARIMRWIDRSPGQGPNGDCWEFTGYREKKSGYGSFSGSGQRAYPAHRYYFELVRGVLPDHIMVCHTCDNPPCCNPAHLFPGTHATNMADRNAKGRQAKGRRWSKLTPDEARIIKFDDDRPHDIIAEAYGVSRSTVAFIKKGKRWGHLRPS